MRVKVNRIEKDLIYLHVFFVILCVIILIIPIPNSIGIKLLILVIIYNVLLPLISKLRNYSDILSIWFFVFLVSLFQIFPDWFLSYELNVLVFPEDGFIKIGTVSMYMAGLWVIPLFIIIFLGLRMQERYSKKIVYLIVILLSLLIFGLAEQSMWILNSWYPQNVSVIFGHLAIYIIIPEIILGFSSFYAYFKSKSEKIVIKILAAFLVMLLYLGSASFFYFFIEKVILF
ncbi:MAG: DUF6989 domain-containing protein [Candidatus Hodarchaeota archaeon]